MRPRSILFAIPELGHGGPDRVVAQLIDALDRDRFSPSLAVIRPGGRYFDRLPADVEVYAIGPKRYPLRGLARAVDRARPDLVFTTLAMNLVAPFSRMIQRHRPPIVARQANAVEADFAALKAQSLVKHRIAEKLVKSALRKAEAVVAQSSDMARELRPSLRRGQRLAVIGNPIDIDETRSRAGGLSAGPRFGAPALVSVGRLGRQKGYDLLLPAFAALRKHYPDAGLTIFGDGSERPALEAQARRLAIHDRVRLAGHSNAALAEVAQADLFVSSSRYEGFSNALLEAMALGTAVVATDCPGATSDMVIEGETGMLAPAHDVDALTAAMRRALSADLAALGERGRTHVARAYDRRAIVGEYERLFDSVASPAGHHPA